MLVGVIAGSVLLMPSLKLHAFSNALGVGAVHAAPLELGGSVEVAFAPEGGAEALVLRTIGAAKSSLRLSAYSFTSAPVLCALLNASAHGVDVALVVDEKGNATDDRSGKSRAALSARANAGIAVRTISRYAIHHDKFIVVDGLHVETGSFNFTASAASRNSENVMVQWNAPSV